jgi:cytochrome c-type biogenesis protein CcmH/NrfG
VTRDADPLFQNGGFALRDGRLPDVATAFQGHLKANPDNAAALYNLGQIHFQNGSGPEAEACFAKAHALRPGHVYTHSMLLKPESLDAFPYP